MSRRSFCPLPDFKDYWIDLPDVWRGEHARRRDETIARLNPDGLQNPPGGNTLLSFAIAISLLDNWHLPGIDGNPDKWDFGQLDLSIIAWVIQDTLVEYNACFAIPKVYSSLS